MAARKGPGQHKCDGNGSLNEKKTNAHFILIFPSYLIVIVNYLFLFSFIRVRLSFRMLENYYIFFILRPRIESKGRLEVKR